MLHAIGLAAAVIAVYFVVMLPLAMLVGRVLRSGRVGHALSADRDQVAEPARLKTAKKPVRDPARTA